MAVLRRRKRIGLRQKIPGVALAMAAATARTDGLVYLRLDYRDLYG